VVFIGTETGGMTTHFWKVPGLEARTIQIDIEPEAIGRNYPAAGGINADAKETLTADARAGRLERPPPGRLGRALSQHRGRLVRRVRPADGIRRRADPSRADVRRPHRHVPDDGIVVVDTGHAGMWMGGMYDLRTPTQSYMRSAGHLGWAFPASLGAKCGAPDRPVVCFTGDSGFWYHVGDIETAVRFGINTVTVVNNNHSGNQSMRGFDRAYGGKQTEQARELWVFTEVDFAAVAETWVRSASGWRRPRTSSRRWSGRWRWTAPW
jgi:acetolactate synthase I/II/III large subunit